jgi:hypothetical protein
MLKIIVSNAINKKQKREVDKKQKPNLKVELCYNGWVSKYWEYSSHHNIKKNSFDKKKFSALFYSHFICTCA